MARRTREQALATRSGILDAAEQLFAVQGVSGTSLQHVAQAAGVTRGAVYWHFADKSALFNAMMARVCLPMEDAAAGMSPADADGPPLAVLRRHLLGILARVVDDAQVRRVFEIATHKVEYVGELVAVRDRHLQMRRDHLALLKRVLQAARRRGDVAAQPSAQQMALGLQALLDGLIQNWMLDPGSFSLRSAGARAIDVHLAGLAAGARPAA